MSLWGSSSKTIYQWSIQLAFIFGSMHRSMEMCARLVGGTNLVLGSWNNENNWPFVILRALMSLWVNPSEYYCLLDSLYEVMLYKSPWASAIVSIIVSNASAKDSLKWSPPLIDELMRLNDAKCAIICEFRSCSPSRFGFGLGCCGLLEGGFSTLCCLLRFKQKNTSYFTFNHSLISFNFFLKICLK